MKRLIPLYWSSLKRLNKSSWGKNSVFMILGIIIAVSALTLSMILFESYEDSLSKAFKVSQPDISIISNQSELTSQQEAKLKEILDGYREDVLAYTPDRKVSVMINNKGINKPAYLQGYHHENKSYNESVYSFARRDTFDVQDNDIILGHYLAKELDVKIGDSIQLVLPSSIRYSIFGLVKKSEKFLVKDIYKTGLYEVDVARGILSSKKLASLSEKKLGQVSYSLILSKRTSEKSREIANKLNLEFRAELPIMYAQDILSYDSAIFSALTLQKIMIFLILCIIVIVAGFNVISTISSIINEKIEEIGILMTLGLTRKQVKLLYYIFSLLLTHIGIFMGLGLGYLLAYILTHQDYFSLKADVYFIDKIMISPSFASMFLIYGTSLLIISLTILISLRSINKLQIINILRR